MATKGSASVPLEDFHVFPNLPPELRDQIWERFLDMGGPTVYGIDIEVQDWSDNSKRVIHTPHGRYTLADATIRMRMLSSTCSESRATAIRLAPNVLQLGFDRDDPRWNPRVSGTLRFSGEQHFVVSFYRGTEYRYMAGPAQVSRMVWVDLTKTPRRDRVDPPVPELLPASVRKVGVDAQRLYQDGCRDPEHRYLRRSDAHDSIWPHCIPAMYKLPMLRTLFPSREIYYHNVHVNHRPLDLDYWEYLGFGTRGKRMLMELGVPDVVFNTPALPFVRVV